MDRQQFGSVEWPSGLQNLGHIATDAVTDLQSSAEFCPYSAGSSHQRKMFDHSGQAWYDDPSSFDAASGECAADAKSAASHYSSAS